MQNGSQKSRKNKGAARKSGRDKSSQDHWDWQTSTGTFETHISDEQLAKLEAASLTILDAPKPQSAVSYWEWREQSRPIATQEEPKNTDGAIKRLIKRFVGVR
ncbi:MAG TPA: hypothetical protein VFS24_19545 [Steroidobacteraceae bacterium]|nr:hypothetical protein [Steroidobacteraceae bacterium]